MTKNELRRSSGLGYHTFVGLLGHCEDALVKKAFAELSKHTIFVKVLGRYPNVSGQVSERTSLALFPDYKT